MCHNTGIHGLGSSSFNVMNVFMLGNTRRGIPGGSGPNTTMVDNQLFDRDAQIRAEVIEGRVLRGGTLDVPVSSSFPADTNVVAAPSAGSTWWYNGTRAIGPVGGLPDAPDAPNVNQFAAARSLATAYTCGEAGCHMNTAMFNLNWGMGFERRDQVAAVDVNTGDRTGGNVNPAGTAIITGHILPSVRTSGSGNTNQACGPCHGGHSAGFPTASQETGRRDDSRRAYGCDQCHDMVGVATNSTAWPHGNRNILVYEWTADGVQHENLVTAGNLWMYGGNIARADHPEVPTNQGNQDGTAITAAGGGATFRGRTSENISFADQSWLVLTGVANGRYGIPNNDAASYFDHPTYGPNHAPPGTTGLTDGSCLKCHVALDSASREALGSVGADALRHAWLLGPDGNDNNGTGAVNHVWDGRVFSNAQRLFLYR
ncbi:MAG: hypothetical protein FWD93_05560, partial [Coriobacteriia bacterium]|nr:hypothetical protein [Coriobacteriia bacterium]